MKSRSRRWKAATMSGSNCVPLPCRMIDRAVDAMLRGALRTMSQQGIDPRYLQLDFDKLRDEMRPRAETEVKGTLILEALAEKQNITASEEDLEKKLEELAAEANVALSQVRKQLRDAETKEALGGYYLIDAESLDEAIEWAAKIPSARDGKIEIRPIVDRSGAGA